MCKKRIPIIVCPILFVGLVIALLIYMSLNPLPSEYYIFQNIEECELLVPNDQSNISIERYGAPIKDKNLKDLPYYDFFGIKFKSNTLEYELFAYEFTNADSALKYYVNFTGEKSYEKKLPLNEQEDNILLSASKGMSLFCIIAVSQNRAYKLIAPSKYTDEINELLAHTFSQSLS